MVHVKVRQQDVEFVDRLVIDRDAERAHAGTGVEHERRPAVEAHFDAGRVAAVAHGLGPRRGAEKSYCFLLTSDKRSSAAEERLGIMEQTSDGFLIAEKDLELRGPGELLGTKQSGLPEFRIGNIVRDQQLLEQARREADFYLSREKSPATMKMMARVSNDARLGLAAVGCHFQQR